MTKEERLRKVLVERIEESVQKVKALAGVLVVAVLIAPLSPAKGGPKSLADIKIAADAGDPTAQTELADRIGATSQEYIPLLRKAAEQGYALAQGKLGNRLLMASRMTIGRTPAECAGYGEEAVKWIRSAAYQGDKRGQADLADISFEGKLVTQNLIEAYKWGDLAAQAGSLAVEGITGRGVRDQAVLKMNAEQIQEARRLVAAFKPGPVPQPQPQVSDDMIKLKGISGTGARRLVLINNESLTQGEERWIKAGTKELKVRCAEIRPSSVIIEVNGEQSELHLPTHLR